MDQPELLVNDATPDVVREALTSPDLLPQTVKVLALLAQMPHLDTSLQPIASPGAPHHWPKDRN